MHNYIQVLHLPLVISQFQVVFTGGSLSHKAFSLVVCTSGHSAAVIEGDSVFSVVEKVDSSCSK